MRAIFLTAMILACMVGCAHPPVIDPDLTDRHSVTADLCSDRFPQGRWQLYHAIEATVPGGKKTGLTGVSVLSSRERTIECALMTLEGFVLFRGRYDGSLIVDRAIAPFDRPGFAKGLMNDLMLLFFAPVSPLQQTGRLENDARICRYGDSQRKIDIILTDDERWRLNQYSTFNRLQRTIDGSHQVPIAPHLILKRRGWAGYTLDLRLVDAVSMDK